MRTICGVFLCTVAVLCVPLAAEAQVKVNKAIADKATSSGFGTYLLPSLVVVLAAGLMVLALMRRSKR